MASVPITNGTTSSTFEKPKGAIQKGIVKQVLSGDSVVIRGQPRGGPPPEKTVGISNITAPRLARRPQDGMTTDVKDEPFAWESREFLREKIIGREVNFIVDYKAPMSGREYGWLYLPNAAVGTEGENLAESLISEGLVDVRQPPGNRPADEYVQHLNELQAQAQAAKRGKWADADEVAKHVREIQWSHDNPRMLVDSFHQKPCKAIIEHVRDGSTIRAFLLPDFHYITLMISGIRCPMIRTGAPGDSGESEPFATEAKFFTESRLLQRTVEIVLESVSNQNFIGTIIHPNGNIAESLLREGFGKCVDWTLGIVTGGPEKLRAAERSAKERRMRVWRSYEPPSAVGASNKTFQAKVIEISSADSLVIQKENGQQMKIFLSSVRPPRAEDAADLKIIKENQPSGRASRPLYDVPFMFEAREFLRKRMIGKNVSVTIDYTMQGNEKLPERTCCTVMIGPQNVAEALVQKGLVSVVRYRQDDENRSSQYDQLLAAEAKAEKGHKGLHALRAKMLGDKLPIVRVQELQGDVNKSRQFLPHLIRAGRCEGIVEFVASGSRMRVFVPKETCLLTFLLSGINCPRGARPNPQMPTMMLEGEPYGDEALQFIKEKCLQREIELEVETADKGGNFVGWAFVDGQNLSEQLVANGLASVFGFGAERSKYYHALMAAEEKAKAQKLNIWANYVDTTAQDEAERAAAEKADRVVAYKNVVVTECSINEKALKFAAQLVDEGPALEQMMRELRAELAANPPLRGSYTPRRGELCAAKFVDDEWYRGKVETIKGARALVLFVDFGNRDWVDVTSCLALLPPQFHSLAHGARDYTMALVQLPANADQDATDACASELRRLMLTDATMKVNVEYRTGGQEYVSVVIPAANEDAASGSSTTPDGDKDVGRMLVEEGVVVVDARRERRLKPLVDKYHEAQQTARRNRVNLWRYGDFMGDDDL